MDKTKNNIKDSINVFKFYKKLSEPLILSLRCFRDRYFAAAWLKKLEEQELGEEDLRISYLKLLILALSRGRLMGIFTDDPKKYKQLIDFRKNFDIHTFAKCMIEKDNEERISNIKKQIKGIKGRVEETSVYFDYSTSLQEYTSAQDIPHFGVHCYYAFSSEPFTIWQQNNKLNLPYYVFDCSKIKKAGYCSGNDRIARCRVVARPVPILGIVEEMIKNKSFPVWGSNILELRENQPVKKISCLS
ncbi:unnamed protein product [Brassicogethes aeneus]|uniref:DUF4485 domain-containing protein n=1 Tax=Brassicogethes aeneus TaxID=1431903 RepID=A0A9P0B0L0_BRAAE|nr:unnamed protein product [Brassicogethes aeneus]